MGLVNRVCASDRLEPETYEYAWGLTQQAPLSQRGAKFMLHHWPGEGELTRDELAEIADRAYESADYREGVRAFLERRAPTFRGE